MDEIEGVPVKPLQVVARGFAVSGEQIGWLFGAGTSASAGIPTAGQLLDEFKAVLYASQNSLNRDEVRMGDPLISNRVRRYFDGAHGLSALGDPREYAEAFELTYPDPAVRRRWLAEWLAAGRPSYGHRVVAGLMAAGFIRWVATTNFDDLVERAYEQLRVSGADVPAATVAAIDSAHRATRALRESDWPLIIKLHGDIQSDRLKNTNDELEEQDATLRRTVLDALRTHGLAVIGYSGRDESVMGTLRAALADDGAFPRGLFWLTRDRSTVFPAVVELLQDARAAGVDACFVESANFDETMGVLARHVRVPQSFSDYVGLEKQTPRVRGVELDLTEAGSFPALRMNALPVVAMPDTAVHVRCRDAIDERPSRLIKEIGFPGFGVASGRDFYGYGLPNVWERALGRYQPEVVEETSLNVDPAAPELVHIGLLNEAVVRALCWNRPFRPRLRRRGHYIVVWPQNEDDASFFEPLVAAYEGAPLTGTYQGRTWREGARVRLDWRLNRVWLVFEPSTFVDPAPRTSDSEVIRRSRFSEQDGAADWVRERWAVRRNKVWAGAVGAWAALLAPEDTSTFSAPFIDNSRLVTARFTIGAQTAFSRPGHRTTRGAG